MHRQPSLWGRLLCHVHGEVSAELLEAYRRASLAVYELVSQAEARRHECHEQGYHPWTVPAAMQAEMLCAWNAFALQTLGDCLLDADYSAQPATSGFVPPKTAEQILAFYSQVEGWLSRAQQAHSNPQYRLDLEVPADLPAWLPIEPADRFPLLGLYDALMVLRERASHAMQSFEVSAESLSATGKMAHAANELDTLRQLYARATAKARYVEDLWGSQPAAPVQEKAEPLIKEAIEQFYVVGQLIAMPHATEYSRTRRPLSPASGEEQWRRSHLPAEVMVGVAVPAPRIFRRGLPLPGQQGFNPWCLTDPATSAQWKQNGRALRAINLLWSLDPDAERTVDTQAEIDEALKAGDIGYALDRYNQQLGHFFRCPWAPIYSVKRHVIIAGHALAPLQQFVFHVSAKGVSHGRPFQREIVTGTFQPTRRVDYGEPDAAFEEV